jgi:magnesium transporter
MDAAFGFASRYAADHPAEAAKRLEGLSPEDVASFVEKVDHATAAKLLDRLAPPIAGSIVEAMETEAASEILALGSVDQCVRVLRHVSHDRRRQILSLLPQRVATMVGRILTFPEGSAGSIADGSVTALPSDMTVDSGRRVSRDPRFPYVYVVDRGHRLVGVAHKRDLEESSERATLQEIMAPVVARVPATASVSQLQRHGAWRHFDALPVVDGRGVYLGAIRHKDLRNLDGRHVAAGGTGQPIATLLDLSELYWLGLSTMVTALCAGTTAARGKESHDGR